MNNNKNKFCEKYSDLIIGVISFIIILLGLTFLIELLELNGKLSADNILNFFTLFMKLSWIAGGYWFFHDKKTISWAIIVGTISYVIANLIYIIYVFVYSLFWESQSLFYTVGYSYDLYIGIRNFLGFLSISFLLLSILNNSVFIKMFKVDQKTVHLSILSGILLFCIFQILGQLIAEDNGLIEFQF